jgi:hypothetical protein
MKHWHKFSILAMLFFPMALNAQLIVDCSGANPNAYPTINAALANAGPGSTILVSGTCNESVNLVNVHSLNLGAWFGTTATVNGWILMDHASDIYLYGLNVTNPNPGGDGFILSFSRNIVVDTCAGNGNGGYGLNASLASDVVVNATGTFNNNGFGGINASVNSTVLFNAWAAPIDISNNGGNGIFATDEAVVGTVGQTIINNNNGSGILMFGNSRGGFGAYYGSNAIQENSGGGVSVNEGSEISFYSYGGGPANLIQSNGSFGAQVGHGAQATFFETAQITDNSGPGVDVFAAGQARFEGPIQVLRNGTNGDPTSAGIRVDGNSEAFLRGGTVSQNYGPGILALVNSSADFAGVTFSGNTGGLITCDSTATMISDVTKPNSTPPAGVNCKTPHGLGNHKNTVKFAFKAPDMAPFKALQARYKKIATKH